jgi:alanine dehydrogenase
VSRTSTKVISNLVVPYLLQIGEMGLQGALESNPSLGRGVYMHKKNIVKRRVAERFGFPHEDLVP